MDTMQGNTSFTEDQLWEALVKRDQRFDGVFFYGVRTTGVYCRPTCKSRLPRRENISFFKSWEEAEKAGFRPCKRCSPKRKIEENAHQTDIIKACDIIDHADRQPSLESLANAVGLSPFYFQRLFKKTVGITPKQYFLEKRSSRIRDNLQHDERITDAIYNSGFGSSSRFYSQAMDTLGMKPSDYKKGGSGLHLFYSIVQSYLGWALVAATGKGICAIYFGDVPEVLEKELLTRFPGASLTKDDPGFANWVTEVMSFLESPQQGLDLPIDIKGTAFQRRVWMALRSIPCGSTVSYSDIAVKIGNPKAVRAVAHACATNEIAVAIPCHRVVRTNGDLAGYRWGIERKRKLLEKESNLPAPHTHQPGT